MIDISVIIVSWNAKTYLLDCLQSIFSETISHQIEIIVVDNLSTDGSSKEVKINFPNVKLIQNNSNMGFAAANNIGIKCSTGRYLCLVNSDIKILDRCLDRMCDYMDKNPSAGMLGPKILNRDMSQQKSCRQFPTLWNNFSPAIGLDKIFPNLNIFSGEQILIAGDDVHNVDVLSGCLMMVRRNALDEVGLFDEIFFIYSEDVDWCKRFWDMNWKVIFYPHAKAIHYGGGSSTNEPVRFSVEQLKAKLQYWRKHYNLLVVTNLILIVFFHQSIRIAIRAFLFFFMPRQRKEIYSQIRQGISCIRLLILGKV